MNDDDYEVKKGVTSQMTLKMTVNNKKIAIEEMEIEGVSQSSLILIGDADVISCTAVFDTPRDSLIKSKEIPIKPLTKNACAPTRLGETSC